MMKFIPFVAASILAASSANAAPPGYLDLKTGVTLETGDTWVDGGKRYRLYGIQSCIRGTSYTDLQGQRRDCGDASLAMLAAYIKDTKPICAPTAQAPGLTYVMCLSTISGDQLDLATIMVTQGFAFASLDKSGLPIFPAYAVAEQDARSRTAGLWQFKDVQHPAIYLSTLANEKAPAQ